MGIEKKMTKRRVDRFLEVLAETGTYATAAKAISVIPKTIRNWRKKYPEFQEACDDALELADDELEAAARDRALNGSTYEKLGADGEVHELRTPPSNDLLKYLLTRHRYKEKVTEPHIVHDHRHIHLIPDMELQKLILADPEIAKKLGE